MKGMERNSVQPIRLPLVVAMLACLYGATALASEAPKAPADSQDQTAQQEQTTEADKAKDKDKKSDKAEPANIATVTVTGSLLKHKEYDSASPIQVITADVSVDLGQVDPAEYLQKASVAAGSTQINNQFSGFVVEGGIGVQTISLRGLGPQRSLVLLNGRRPGPAGTRGQVAAFDLNVLPASIIQRAEILKDGASSIYGSDAVAGVVNLITRANIDRPEVTVSGRMPFDSGGENFDVSAADGWSFDNGSIVAALEWQKFQPLKVGDRDFFGCPQDLFRDSQGNLIDREDHSVIGNTPLGGCNNLYANTVIDAVYGYRYIPSPDGVTIGLIPGYRPRANTSWAGGGPAYYEDVLNFDFYKNQYILNGVERFSAYANARFSYDNFDWHTEVLLNRRTTKSERFRQFFPLTGGSTAIFSAYRYANSPDFVTPVPSGIAQPVIPFRSNTNERVNYYYINTGLEGQFASTDTWSWRADASFSRSDGDYTSLGIVASRSGDVRFDNNAPTLDYFSPEILSGQAMDQLQAAIGQWHTGNTVYKQSVFTAIATGDLAELPAGPLGAAFGIEHRRFSIDDEPSDLSRNGDLWGQSSAQVTKGKDHVTEAFMELEVPLIKGKPGIESLSATVSGRVADYSSVSGSDNVWKAGLNWQIVPALRLRATRGTSFRAPGLYELYLGNQTAFLSQLSIDPCVDWGNSTNTNLRTNCAAAGVPDTYAGGGASATIVSGGGAGLLKPETSKATTVGLVFTPTFADFSVAIDYFKIQVNDQIARLGGAAILGGCYGSPNYPNAYCDLFDRNPGTDPTAPYAITQVRDSYLNVNKQATRGYDVLFNYNHEFAAGKFGVQGDFTYVLSAFERLFSAEQASGFDTNDFNGDITRPKLTGNVRTWFERGDWTYTWFVDYVQATHSLSLSPTTPYFRFPNAVRDIKAEQAFYHGLSARYEQADWSLVVGVRNIFDKAPPTVSSGVVSRYGNVPAFATQYDWYGRTLFAQLNYKF